MVAIPLPLSTAPGDRPQESSGRLINCYAEPLGEGARHKASIKRVPGLSGWGTSPLTGWRGCHPVGGLLYAAFEGQLARFVSAGGTASTVGPLAGTKGCFFALNNNATPNLAIVDPDNGAFVVTSGVLSDLGASNLPQPCDVCFLGGYFFFAIADGRCFASGINDTTINALDFITAEGNPDGLLRCIPFNGQLLLCGSSTIEPWSGSVVNETGFPFNRVTVIQRGIFGRYAIAGYEDGFGRALIFVGNDKRVYTLTGNTAPEAISPPDLDRLIEQIEDRDTLEASVHVANGRAAWVLSSPDWTWEFNTNTLKWNERASHGLPRWRGTQSRLAFNKWLIGDTESGNVLQVDASNKTEVDEPLRMRIESAPIQKFPARVGIASISIDATMGVGIATGTDPNQTDPTMEISVSPDGGATWRNPRMVKMGAQARAKQRASATRFGLSGTQGMRVRIDISDPVDAGVMGGDASAELRP